MPKGGSDKIKCGNEGLYTGDIQSCESIAEVNLDCSFQGGKLVRLLSIRGI